ncbi:hypothetical protein [Fibrobacter sp. UWB16]|uniref:hypothetical protein n=1 Tax=Fibrobacter sp. UWB16 TaxID=1945874 RepID=UPI001F3FA553|nr:hypothetical protein [Fibrobacter sp. UWB16]
MFLYGAGEIIFKVKDLFVKRIRKFIVLLFSVSLLFLCGCSQSNEDDVRKAKRFEALKGLPLDTVLTRAFKFYERFQATGDTLLRDSMNDYRNHFFARWELTSDSLCGTVPADDSLAADLREIYKVVMTFQTKFFYWESLDDAQRESFLNNTDSYGKLKILNGDSDLLNALIMDIPLEEAVSGLKKAYSIYDSIYFVQKMNVMYFDTSASDTNEMDKIDMFHARRDGRKEAKVACMDKTPMGHKVLVLSKEYKTLMNDFMNAKVDWEHRDRPLLRKIQSFWIPKIIVVPLFWGGFLLESPPIISNAVFNKSHDLVKLNVGDGDRGRYYYLSKKNGKWKLVKIEDGWFS